MNDFLSMLNQYDKIVLDVNVFTDDDAVLLQGIKFNVYDYYEEETYLKLVQFNGAELILPKEECSYLSEEEDGGNWVFKHGNLQIFILPSYLE